MRFALYVDGQLIDSIAVAPEGDFTLRIDTAKDLLLKKHVLLLATTQKVPEFVLEGVRSRMVPGAPYLRIVSADLYAYDEE